MDPNHVKATYHKIKQLVMTGTDEKSMSYYETQTKLLKDPKIQKEITNFVSTEVATR